MTVWGTLTFSVKIKVNNTSVSSYFVVVYCNMQLLSKQLISFLKGVENNFLAPSTRTSQSVETEPAAFVATQRYTASSLTVTLKILTACISPAEMMVIWWSSLRAWSSLNHVTSAMHSAGTRTSNVRLSLSLTCLSWSSDEKTGFGTEGREMIQSSAFSSL